LNEKLQEDKTMDDLYREFLQELTTIHVKMIERLLKEEPAPILATFFMDLGLTYIRISDNLRNSTTEADERNA